MGVRESFESQPKAVAIAAALIVSVTAFIVWRHLGGATGSDATQGSAFFTVDDGHTYFADAAARVAPFEKDGKQAVQAAVFSCDDGKSRFVGYLQRADHAARQSAETKGGGSGQAYGAAVAVQATYEIKRPGEAKWVALRSTEGAKILQVKCPEGQKGPPIQVTP